MLQRAASNAYTWWWASHIRTKQSKWLDNNLQDMEEKVKSMLKLIEEDADTFAKKAEMYYRRRPELINFVQESYKSYRALAERYDHISGELHKANNTIASVFPDQVHFGEDDEEDDMPPPEPNMIESRKFQKPMPQTQQVTSKKSIKPSTLQTLPNHKRTSSQTSTDKAKEEIDKLQKGILALQTEKEFVKSSYESGLAKYWDIEKRIMEMQEKVCSLQDEFSAAIIEDDEARALMVATALKSCEDTLVNLHEQQKKSTEEAKFESQRIKNAKEKLRALKCRYGHQEADYQEPSSSNASGEPSSTDENLGDEACNLKEERLQLQSVCEKVRKNLEMNSEMSVVDLAEKIDGLVNKVIDLESTVSSQTAQIQRLRLETDELQKHLQSLEEEKITLIDDSKDLSEKLRQAEEELQRIQDLDRSVRHEGGKLQTHFCEAYHTFNDLSDRLQSPEQQNEVSIVGSNGPEVANSSQPENDCKEQELLKSHKEENMEAPNEENLKAASDETIDETHGTKKLIVSPNDQDTKCEGEVKRTDISSEENNESQAKGCVAEDTNGRLEVSKQEEGEIIKVVLSQGDQNSGIDGNRQTKGVENWQQLFLDDLEDREKILLVEYTSILRSFKDTRRKLTESEKRNQEHLFNNVAQMRDLKNSIVMKDEEIRSLRQKLSFLVASCDDNSDAHTAEPDKVSAKSRLAGTGNGEASLSSNFSTESSGMPNSGITREQDDKKTVEDKNMDQIGEACAVSSIEEKFRKDIDELLEENLDFWFRFSSSFQQIQKYRVMVQDLQSEIQKLKESKKQEGISTTTGTGERSAKSEAMSIHKQLKELQTDLSVWIEQNALLKEELQTRFASLCNIKEEISRVSNEGIEGEEVQFTAYQAAKFQGEVVNMQHENNKVADELQSGLDHVRGFQAEVEKVIAKLNEDYGLLASRSNYHHHFRNFSTRTRIPLRSFLFGVKPKPKKPSIFSCMNPALQKQYSDLASGLPHNR